MTAHPSGQGPLPTPLFLGKRLQAVENKRNARVKERKEKKRGGKLLQQLNLPGRHRIQGGERWSDPRPFFGCVANKGFANRRF